MKQNASHEHPHTLRAGRLEMERQKLYAPVHSLQRFVHFFFTPANGFYCSRLQVHQRGKLLEIPMTPCMKNTCKLVIGSLQETESKPTQE